MKHNFVIMFILLTVAQILLCNYLHLSAYVMLSILPVMILCIPTRVSTTAALFVAFATGLAVDLVAEGITGLNTLALVPVAFARRPVCDFIFGEELVARNDDFSIRKYGIGKVAFAVAIVQSLFLIIYIIADGAGTRTFFFNAARFVASLAAGTLLSMAVADMLGPDDRK